MTSEVEICNLALAHVRGGSINSLTEKSTQAQYCKLLYPVARDAVLTDVPWNFNHRVKPLALLTDDLFNWIYTYQYPADCLRINRLLNSFEEVSSADKSIAVGSRFYDRGLPRPNLHPQVEYEIQIIPTGTSANKVIATNETEARISYRAQITDPNLFDSQFVKVLGHLLGSELAVPIVGGDQGLKYESKELQLYQAYLAAATAGNQNEDYREEPDSEFVSVRS